MGASSEKILTQIQHFALPLMPTPSIPPSPNWAGKNLWDRFFWDISKRETSSMFLHPYKTSKDHPISQIRRLKKQPCFFRAFSDWSQIELKNCGKLRKSSEFAAARASALLCFPREASFMWKNSSEKQQYCMLTLVAEYKVETKVAFFFPSPFLHFPSLHQQGKRLPYAGTEKVKKIKQFSISNQNGHFPFEYKFQIKLLLFHFLWMLYKKAIAVFLVASAAAFLPVHYFHTRSFQTSFIINWYLADT